MSLYEKIPKYYSFISQLMTQSGNFKLSLFPVKKLPNVQVLAKKYVNIKSYIVNEPKTKNRKFY